MGISCSIVAVLVLQIEDFKSNFLSFVFLDPSKQEKDVFISVEFFSAASFSLQCGATLEMLIYIS